MIDLHTHSSASDGTLSPKELVMKAYEKGIKFLALTDHDTVAGNDEAALNAAQYNIHFIHGIELSVEYKNLEIHLLGLGLESISDEQKLLLEKIKNNRTNRNNEILQRINEAGFSLELKELYELAGSENIGRPHFAKSFVEKGWAKSIKEAFARYLGDHKAFYIPREHISLEQGINFIQKSNGLAIIAHPRELKINNNRFLELLPELCELGVDGLEAYHSSATEYHCHKLLRLAEEHNLVWTAGSDFHGSNKKNTRLGHSTRSSIPLNKIIFDIMIQQKNDKILRILQTF